MPAHPSPPLLGLPPPVRHAATRLRCSSTPSPGNPPPPNLAQKQRARCTRTLAHSHTLRCLREQAARPSVCLSVCLPAATPGVIGASCRALWHVLLIRPPPSWPLGRDRPAHMKPPHQAPPPVGTRRGALVVERWMRTAKEAKQTKGPKRAKGCSPRHAAGVCPAHVVHHSSAHSSLGLAAPPLPVFIQGLEPRSATHPRAQRPRRGVACSARCQLRRACCPSAVLCCPMLLLLPALYWLPAALVLTCCWPDTPCLPIPSRPGPACPRAIR
jgi:hypothetical protein